MKCQYFSLVLEILLPLGKIGLVLQAYLQLDCVKGQEELPMCLE